MQDINVLIKELRIFNLEKLGGICYIKGVLKTLEKKGLI